MPRPHYTTYPISLSEEKTQVWCIARNGIEIAFNLQEAEAKELVKLINNDLYNILLPDDKMGVLEWFLRPLDLKFSSAAP